MHVARTLLTATVMVLTLGTGSASAQAQAYPPAGYSPLLFDPADTKYVFRLNGAPWICRGDTFCKPLKIEGVADKDLPQATVESLGFAGSRYFLSYKQTNFEKGKPVVLSCVEERCGKLDATVGDAHTLGTFQVKQGDRTVTRTALLRQVEARNGLAQLLWCADSGCSELPLTRDAELYLSHMDNGRSEGRSMAWLRDKSGAVFSCAQPEDGISDQLTCEKSKIVLSDFPAAAAPPAAPVASDADRAALASSIDRAIIAGDFANADRLLADAARRYAGNAAWQSLQQKLAKARADRDAQLRVAEARRLITEARRFAQVGDFPHGEAMLQDADKQVPGFAETAKARNEIAAMRTARDQRYQYYAAIDQAFAAEQLWDVERLLAEYAQRFNQDDEYRSRAGRLAQLRAEASWQARLNQARSFIATARQAMDRGEFAEAERQLVLADRAAPGFPEINQARADLSRRRIAAERQQDGIRLILAAIDAAFQRKQYDEAERAIEDGRRRYGSYDGWADLQRRNASARQGNDRQATELRTQNARTLELVTVARRSVTQGDFAAADRSLTQAQAISATMPEIAIARAELERAKADRARQDAEIRAVAASADAALARRQYADAERLIADGKKASPSYAGWAELSRRLAEARRATPALKGNAPMPAQPAATTPPPAAATPAPAPPVAPKLAQLIAVARDAITRLDFATAEKAVADAEKLDATAASVVEVRAELKAARDKSKASPAPPPPPPAPPPPAAAPAQPPASRN